MRTYTNLSLLEKNYFLLLSANNGIREGRDWNQERKEDEKGFASFSITVEHEGSDRIMQKVAMVSNGYED